MNGRYYVMYDGIPLREQPEEGYTRNQAILRVMREAEWAHNNLGVDWKEAKLKRDICTTKTFVIDVNARSEF